MLDHQFLLLYKGELTIRLIRLCDSCELWINYLIVKIWFKENLKGIYTDTYLAFVLRSAAFVSSRLICEFNLSICSFNIAVSFSLNINERKHVQNFLILHVVAYLLNFMYSKNLSLKWKYVQKNNFVKNFIMYIMHSKFFQQFWNK